MEPCAKKNSFPASKTGERPNPLSSAWDGDQNRRASGRPCLAMFLAKQATQCGHLTVALTLAAATWTLNEGTI